ncbi:MATE family efflux transporter [Spiroplasma endosymbiont of Labia minor]|uniref:MATE family efflux transporter n=1 Tax=Spiroplasma endosymbiont of Labia minor TaxID=3066305 RepID=UPI0030CD8E17
MTGKTNTNNKHVLDHDTSQGMLEIKTQLFTKREWILRYASPLGSLLFMAGPMIMITLVNGLYGIIDKQLTLNFAMEQIKDMYFNPGATTEGLQIWSPNEALGNISIEEFAKQLINVSTQYSNTIVTILMALSLLTSVGTAIRFGQAMGARDKEKMDRYIVTGLIQTAVMSIIGTLILHFIYPYIITTQAGIDFDNRLQSLQYQLASEYTDTFIMGFSLLAFATYISTLMRTEGKVWWVIGINLTSVVINIVLGIVFMENLGMGMKGAVYGSMTAWSFMILSGLTVIILSKNTLLIPDIKKYKFIFREAGKVWLNGLSPFISNLVFAIISYTSTILITNLHDVKDLDYKNIIQILLLSRDSNGNVFNVVSGEQLPVSMFDPGQMDPEVFFKQFQPYAEENITTSIQVLSSTSPWIAILYAPILGMMQGGNANFAYNYGAGKRERMRKIFIIMLTCNLTWAACVMIIMIIVGGPMMAAFYGPDDKKWWFVMYYSCFIVTPFTFSAISLYQGMGKTKWALLIALMRAIVFQLAFIFMGYAIAKNTSNDGSKDWLFFLIASFQELLSAGFAVLILLHTIRSAKKRDRLHDDVDSFVSPTYAQAIANEISIEHRKSSNYINNKFDKSIAKVEVRMSKTPDFLNEQIEKLNIKRNQLLGHTNIKAKLNYQKNDIYAKYEKEILLIKEKINLAKETKNKIEVIDEIKLLQKIKHERNTEIRKQAKINHDLKKQWIEELKSDLNADINSSIKNI